MVKHKETPERQEIYRVNSETKLVESIERYRRQGDARELVPYSEIAIRLSHTLLRADSERSVATVILGRVGAHQPWLWP